MKTRALTTCRRLVLLAACLWTGAACTGVPSFSAAEAVNAASFTGGAVAPGEIVTVQGSDLGPAVPRAHNYRDFSKAIKPAS